jgi:catechol 2,3-dioxygenase-like lactoylglutathione lyase family enzyme
MTALDIPALWHDQTGTQWANLVVTAGEHTTSGLHLAFGARTRDEVDAFHAAGLAAGGRDNGPPGLREEYSSEAAGRYYAAFLLDPDGNNVEAVFRDTY